VTVTQALYECNWLAYSISLSWSMKPDLIYSEVY